MTDQEAKPARETRFAYYRRCAKIRENGEQCKGPAMKDDEWCYSHRTQADAAKRFEDVRRSMAMPEDSNPRAIARALTNVANALLNDRIDDETGQRLLDQLSRLVHGGQVVKPEVRQTNVRQWAEQMVTRDLASLAAFAVRGANQRRTAPSNAPEDR